MKRTWKRWAVTGAFMLVGWTGACSDRGITEPRFARPSGTIIGLDTTERLARYRELGGDAAMAEIASQVESARLDPTDPLARAVAEWRAKQGTVSGPAASRMWEGVEQYGGEYYVWSGGEFYAPAHKKARIYNLLARADRDDGGPVYINVTFKFEGHRASNDAEWTLKTAMGDEIRSRARGSFGSQTNPFLGIGDRGWAAQATEYDVGCDVVVNGDTRAKAWYDGSWNVNGVSIGVNPTGATGSVNLTNDPSGMDEASRGFNTTFTCPPPGGGGAGGYGGGGSDCDVCQQWFLPVGEDWLIEWWECGPADPRECFGYEI